MAEDQCVAIVLYEVNAEDAEKFLNAWERANEFLKQQPGFVSTTLHHATSASPAFRFVNVAQWRSADDFRNATQSNGFSEASGALMAYTCHAAAYEPIRS